MRSFNIQFFRSICSINIIFVNFNFDIFCRFFYYNSGSGILYTSDRLMLSNRFVSISCISTYSLSSFDFSSIRSCNISSSPSGCVISSYALSRLNRYRLSRVYPSIDSLWSWFANAASLGFFGKNI